jgi:hypothetical protein
MTKKEKEIFINELIKNVKRGILEKIDSIPENWDGMELRMLVSDHFQVAVFRRVLSRSRLVSYKNDILVRNLI